MTLALSPDIESCTEESNTSAGDREMRTENKEGRDDEQNTL